jgi:hypothetical protein
MKLDIGKYIIDKEFQYSYVIRSLILLFFVILSTSVVIIVWNKFRFYQGFLLSVPTGQEVMEWAKIHGVKPDSSEFAFRFLTEAKPYSFYNIIIMPVLIIFAINAFVIGLASFYISYKIAFPLHKLKIALRRKVETGNFDKPLTVRKEDPFHELISLANLAFVVAGHPGIKRFDNSAPDPEEKPEREPGEERRKLF